ncbi:MAG: carboxypeptidase-like regulatory domain-containing protein, partial [Terriglobales bacterium]
MKPMPSTKIRFRLWAAGLLPLTLLSMAVLGLCATGWAQTSMTGLLRGVVTDPSGRVVANADVRVTNERTNEVRTVKTGADGAYTVPLLPPGTYQVDIDAKGFARTIVSSVVIAVTETNVENVTVKVSSALTAVEVKG